MGGSAPPFIFAVVQAVARQSWKPQAFYNLSIPAQSLETTNPFRIIRRLHFFASFLKQKCFRAYRQVSNEILGCAGRPDPIVAEEDRVSC